MLNTKFGTNWTNRFDDVDDTYQIWCIEDEPFRSYSIFSKFQFFVGGHLGFWKITVLSLLLSVWRQCEAPYQTWWESIQRFWSYSSFCKFLNSGAAILDSVFFQIYGLLSHFVSPFIHWNEIWCMELERFRSCGVLSIFQFPYTLTWDFTAHAHKTGNWFPIFTANELVRPTRVLVV